MIFLKLGCYAVLGVLLGHMGFSATKNWQFYAVLFLAIAIDILSALT